MSQAEFHFIRARLQGGTGNKAQRGELRFPLPVGYVYGEEPGSVLLDPDAEVQSAVRLVFTLFRQSGSAYGAIRHFLQHNLSFPRRERGRSIRGEELASDADCPQPVRCLNQSTATIQPQLTTTLEEGEPQAGGAGVENQNEISALFCRCWCSVSYGWDKDWNSGTQRVFVCRITARLSLVLREIVTEEVLNGSVEFGCQVR
jgi:hypothetical protein